MLSPALLQALTDMVLLDMPPIAELRRRQVTAYSPGCTQWSQAACFSLRDISLCI